MKGLGSPDAVAALCLRVHSGVRSDHRAVGCVLLDVEADGGSGEFWAFIHVTDSDLDGDGVPLCSGASQISLITCHDLKIDHLVLLIIHTLWKTGEAVMSIYGQLFGVKMNEFLKKHLKILRRVSRC